jgi:hypothetical protein
LGIGDWGLGIGHWAQSPIPNPQSPIPNPQSPFFKLNIFYEKISNNYLIFNNSNKIMPLKIKNKYLKYVRY